MYSNKAIERLVWIKILNEPISVFVNKFELKSAKMHK